MLYLTFLLSFIEAAPKYEEPRQQWPMQQVDTLFQYMNYGSKNFRIPGIVYLKDHSLLTVADIRYNHAGDLPAKIAVIARKKYIGKNEDWSDGYIISGPVRDAGDGDPALVTDRKTGTVYCIWSGDRGYQGGSMSTPDNPARVYFTRSHDYGLTWEDKRDITHFIYSKLCTTCSTDRQEKWKALFVSSGAGIQTREGRITFACLVYDQTTSSGVDRNYLLYTDDFGETWDMEPGWPVSNANEAKLVQLNNGELLLSIRQGGQRKFAWTKDLGKTWYKASPQPEVVDPGCNGEIKRYTSTIDGFDKDRIIHSISYSPSGRKNVSLMISYDEGATWPYKKTLEIGGSAYSSLDCDKEGNIYIYYEKDGISTYDLVVANVTLSWLTNGADTYQKPTLLQWCLTNDATTTKCPAGHHKFNTKVFDQYVESYNIYPEEMHYTFTEDFRNFNVDLTYEGLVKGTYNNIGKKKFKIDFIGHNESERTLTLKNIDLTIPTQELTNIDFKLDNSIITITNANDTEFVVSWKKIEIVTGSKKRNLDIPQNCQVIIENTGSISISKVNTQSNMLLEDFGVDINIKSVSRITSVTVKGAWTKEEGKSVKFEDSNEHKMTVIVQPGTEGSFVASGGNPSFVVKDPSITTEATKDDDNNNDAEGPNTSAKSSGLALPWVIVTGIAGILVGIVFGVVIALLIKRRGRNGDERSMPSDKNSVFKSLYES